MSQIDHRRVLAGIAASAGAAAVPVTAGAEPGPAGKARPVIVFIMAEDLGYAGLSSTGSRHICAPAIDGIATDGLHLRREYTLTPVCFPTRTALFTGRYAQPFR